MSTKTTIKRIALVAVSALGLGVVAAVSPAHAGVTTGITLNANSITVVSSSTSTAAALVEITVATSDSSTAGLSASESITATVVGVPTNVTASKTLSGSSGELQFMETKGQTSGTDVDWTKFTPDSASANNYTDGVITNANTSSCNNDHTTTDASCKQTTSYNYFLKITPSNGGSVIDQGVYTVAIDLRSSGNIIQRQLLKIDFVSDSSNSGAVLTAAAVGSWFVGDSATASNQSTTRYIKATLTNRDGGRLFSTSGSAPTLTASVVDSSTTPVYETLTPSDDGTANEYNYSATATSNAAYANDGVYTLSKSTAWLAAKGPATVTVRYGLASATASVVINAAATTGTKATAGVTATGKVAGTNAATLPLTTKSLVAYVSVADTSTAAVAQTGYAMYYTISYSGCTSGDMLPVKNTTPVKVLTDATGVASVTITNSYPVDSCAATVTWSGAATNPSAQVYTWAKPAAASAVPNPGGSYQALTKSAQKVTWTIVDQFGAPIVGAPVVFSHTGANAPTVVPATVNTDANGQVSYSWTDAAGIPADATYGTDTVKVSTVSGVAPTTSAGAITVTWKSALSVVSTLYATYSTYGASGVVVPTTTYIGGAAGLSNSKADQYDTTKAITATIANSGDPFVNLTVTAKDSSGTAVTGVPTTFSVANGYLLDAANKIATSRIVYANDTVSIIGLKTGVTTVTATNGTLTSVTKINWVNSNTDARVIKLSESSGTVTATVTDFYGNPVKSASVDVVVDSTARLGNGATSSSFLTAADGTVTFAVTGAGSVTASLAPATYTKTANLAGYGDSTGVVVTTGAPAGVSSATVSTSGIAATSDSIDAANEATDAANAATDAANAAAEAADAATAAAQDAQAAVAALASQVADLITGIKAQITALTNLVIKIQKKVKA